MNCRAVRNLIAEIPASAWLPNRGRLARAHIDTCPACRVALKTEEALSAMLTSTPLPAAPGDLAGRILTRIERLEPTLAPLDMSGAEVTPEERDGIRAEAGPARSKSKRHRIGWTVAASGALLGVTAHTYRILVGEVELRIVAGGLGRTLVDAVELQAPTPALALTAFGAVTLFIGLLWPAPD